MRRLYEPGAYYTRVRTFLDHCPARGSGQPLAPRDLVAFARSLWLLGIREKGRGGYWRLLGSTLLRRPRQLGQAIELAILGHHFRRVAAGLSVGA